jgi:hypothetical protein
MTLQFTNQQHSECYCASSIDAQTGVEKANGVCDLPCPGNSLEACGGNCPTGPRLRNRNQQRSMLLDVYECSVPTTTSSSTSTTSCTTSCGPDVSSDPDSEPEKKGIHADMETSQRKGRFAPKLRRGGMLRNPNKAVKGPALAKRDYGLKRNGLM